ncbi:metallophosphoesterase family protein [Thioalkalivibrio paradoxus]|uniref:Metallophosphoesterase n=1 Tax=Thioalkalivibrio paradoxus ARh 1 TaxID=713585 RepID=W0DNI9_9GAMM|nr:DNA repair exonuclease [Thioalkalivibrio paradoxus]AHE98563.1 metallophosphoesterase [Thioalkalivibrio paradoxus ARh 1]
MGSFRFLHAADIHLDSPLRGLSGQEGSAAERIRTATREAFVQLVGDAIDRQVDFVVIAGDLYDGDWRDYRTGLFFAAQMGRLNEAGIPVFLLHGNHDAESQLTRRLTLPDNVRVFGARRPETFRLDACGVALHGQSFAQRELRENLVPAYPDPIPHDFNIGVLHTGLGGLGGHENYAPCALGDLLAKGYDYWALGHVHQFQILHPQPPVVFPGNLQGRHIREAGDKGAVLVTVEAGTAVDVAPLAVDVVRWSRVQADLTGAGSLGEAVERLQAAIADAVAAEGQGRLLACRVECQGSTPIHGELQVSGDRLLAEARAAAVGLGTDAAWVEKVVVATTATGAERTEPAGELEALWQEAATDPELLARLAEDPGAMLRRLPYELRAELESDSILTTALAEDPAALAMTVVPWLSQRLAGEGEED